MMLENQDLEEIQETKLLGVIINNKLNWDSNTDFLVEKANAKMRILHKLVDFQVPSTENYLLSVYPIPFGTILPSLAQLLDT